MNYRHCFHAGNFADLHKHLTLVSLIRHLTQKDKPLCFVDSHAGIGLYDLTSPEAARSPEYLRALIPFIKKVPTDNPDCKAYLDAIQSYQVGEKITYYPGSPLIALSQLRHNDSLILNELHPEDCETLKSYCTKKNGIHIHQRDAYEFLPAILPTKPARAIVYIDPPYEEKTEFKKMENLLQKLLNRFSNGIYLIWYPIKSEEEHQKLIKLSQKIEAPSLRAEITLSDHRQVHLGLIGSGLLMINPPWQFESKWEALQKILWETLSPDGKGSHRLFQSQE